MLSTDRLAAIARQHYRHLIEQDLEALKAFSRNRAGDPAAPFPINWEQRLELTRQQIVYCDYAGVEPSARRRLQVEAALEDKKRLPAKTRAKYQTAIDAFVAVVGDKPMWTITGDDVIAVKDTLMKTPLRYRTATALRLDNIVGAQRANEARAEDQRLATLSPVTINDGYSPISSRSSSERRATRRSRTTSRPGSRPAVTASTTPSAATRSAPPISSNCSTGRCSPSASRRTGCGRKAITGTVPGASGCR